MKHDKEVEKAIEERFGKLARRLPDERQAKGTYEESLRTGPNGDIVESPLANPDILSDENVLLPESGEAQQRQQIIHDERVFAINNCNLTPQQRRVIELIEKGYVQEQIATQLKISREAVKNLLARARNKIKKFYNQTRTNSENE